MAGSKMFKAVDETLISESARDFIAIYKNLREIDLYDKAIMGPLRDIANNIPEPDRVLINYTINLAEGPAWGHGVVWKW
jgi:hypothetical protein